MKDYSSYLTIENVIFAVVVIVFISGAWYLIHRVLSNKREKRRKENPFVLTVEHIDQLFKIREVEKDKNIGLLSSDPTIEYSSGTGYPAWFKLDNVPEELKFVANVIKVIEGPDGKARIVPVRYDKLPTEKETEEIAKKRKAQMAT